MRFVCTTRCALYSSSYCRAQGRSYFNVTSLYEKFYRDTRSHVLNIGRAAFAEAKRRLAFKTRRRVLQNAEQRVHVDLLKGNRCNENSILIRVTISLCEIKAFEPSVERTFRISSVTHFFSPVEYHGHGHFSSYNFSVHCFDHIIIHRNHS